MKRFAIALCLVAAAAACSRNAPINRPLEQRDTVYTPRAAMLIHAYQPRRALAIIDSAVIVGNASPFLADFLRAKTYAESELDPGKDTTVSLSSPCCRATPRKPTPNPALTIAAMSWISLSAFTEARATTANGSNIPRSCLTWNMPSETRTTPCARTRRSA